MTREQHNGPLTVQKGVILKQNFEKYEHAKSIAALKASKDGEHTYEVTGVQGDYRIIKRDIVPTFSKYLWS